MYLIHGRVVLDPVLAAWEPPLAEFVDDFVAGDPTGHDIYHSLRVKALALRIAAGESLDQDVMVATAYLHDIGRHREQQGQGDHVHIGMAAAREILPAIPFPADKVEAVLRCIEYHEEYEWARKKQELDRDANREVFGFQDADRLDAMGAVGIGRMFTYGGAYHRPLWVPEVKPGHWEHPRLNSSSYNHLHEKLLKLKDTMNTPTGRLLAESRHRFMKQFAEEFEKEWYGKE